MNAQNCISFYKFFLKFIDAANLRIYSVFGNFKDSINGKILKIEQFKVEKCDLNIRIDNE